jgi:hypothetical protein
MTLRINDIEHNDTQNNNIYHIAIHLNGSLQNDTQNNIMQYNDILQK